MHVLWETDRWLQKYCVSNNEKNLGKDDVNKGTIDLDSKAVAADAGGGVPELEEDTETDRFHSTLKSSLW